MAQKNGKRVDSHTVAKPVNADTTAISGTSARLAIASEVVAVRSTTDCYLKSGDSTVVAASGDHDIFLPANSTYTIRIASDTHLAVIQDSAGGTLYTSEMI